MGVRKLRKSRELYVLEGHFSTRGIGRRMGKTYFPKSKVKALVDLNVKSKIKM